jgi:hypothetical protein
MSNRFERVCQLAEAKVVDTNTAKVINVYEILDWAEQETGEFLEEKDKIAAVEWLDYFCSEQGYIT